MLLQILRTYLIAVNAAAFVLMLADKQKARRGAWRIPEATLIGIALFGGSIGALIGMYSFRHKTKHPQFTIGIPVILILQITGVIAVYLFFHA